MVRRLVHSLAIGLTASLTLSKEKKRGGVLAAHLNHQQKRGAILARQLRDQDNQEPLPRVLFFFTLVFVTFGATKTSFLNLICQFLRAP